MFDPKTIISDPACEQCQALWRVYATATSAHIRLTSKQKIAELQHDRLAIDSLEFDLAAAERDRTAGRRAIEEHEKSAHGIEGGGRSAGVTC